MDFLSVGRICSNVEELKKFKKGFFYLSFFKRKHPGKLLSNLKFDAFLQIRRALVAYRNYLVVKDSKSYIAINAKHFPDINL